MEPETTQPVEPQPTIEESPPKQKSLLKSWKLETRLVSKLYHLIWDFISGEIFLWYAPNSGAMVFWRTLWITAYIYALAIFLRDILAPEAIWWTLSKQAFCRALYDTIPWLGAILAAVYAALYTRFASQWGYLAGLYNQIMATQAQVRATQAQTPTDSKAADEVLILWKAGFIEDAEAVHLATKPMYAGIIKSLLESKEVQAAYAKHTPGGKERLRKLEHRVNKAWERENERRATSGKRLRG